MRITTAISTRVKPRAWRLFRVMVSVSRVHWRIRSGTGPTPCHRIGEARPRLETRKRGTRARNAHGARVFTRRGVDDAGNTVNGGCYGVQRAGLSRSGEVRDYENARESLAGCKVRSGPRGRRGSGSAR